MRLNDVRILWARSGNRCAYPKCRTEMAPDGTKTTLGEIAHIVAKSNDGPRGNDPLPLEQRDDYDNLILLCPTHHKIVDDNYLDWPVESLKRMKSDHESWVDLQLDKGNISVQSLSGNDFLTIHTNSFLALNANASWIYSSLTPLSITDEAISPKSKTIVDSINQTMLPDMHCNNPRINERMTRPSEFGLLNEDLRRLSEGKGHRIEIFRNGHVEMAICIEGMCQYLTSVNRSRYNILNKFIHFDFLRNYLESEVSLLKRTWSAALPFYNMFYTAIITNTEKSNLVFSSGYYSKDNISNPMKSSSLLFSQVVERATSGDELLHSSLERFVESFGWIYPTLNDPDGKPSIPKSFIGY
jgi:hypothetical protein